MTIFAAAPRHSAFRSPHRASSSRSREVRADGRVLPDAAASRPSRSSCRPRAIWVPRPQRISAADALARAPLAPLARLALTRRLEGTYTVELERVSAAWLASVELRGGRHGRGCRPHAWPAATTRSPGRSRPSSAAVCASAARSASCARKRTRCTLRAHGVDERYDRAVLAVPLPLALALLPALRERAGYARLWFGVASKLHVPLAEPAAPGAVQGLEAAFWTWTASGRGGGPATRRLRVRGRRAAPRRARARARRRSLAARLCECSAPELRPGRRAPCSRAGATSSTAAARTPATLPDGRGGTTRTSLRRTAASISPASTRRPSSAARSRARSAAAPAPPPRCSQSAAQSDAH